MNEKSRKSRQLSFAQKRDRKKEAGELFFVVKLKSGETKDFKFNEVKIQEEKK